MRHGKSDWNKLGQEDRERPLAPRGERASRDIAAWLKAHDIQPDAVLVSTAKRTQETWRLLQKTLAPVDAITDQDALYLASPGEILEQLAGVADRHQTVLIIGHNPGLESLCHLLAGPGTDRGALDELRRGMPTAALAIFELTGDSWAELGSDGARLVEFVRPRELE